MDKNEFDAKRCLYDLSIPLLVHDVPLLDNISQCKILEDNPLASLTRAKAPLERPPGLTRTKEREQAVQAKIEKNFHFIDFSKVLSAKVSGPYEMLHECMNAGSMIDVLLHEGKRMIGNYIGKIDAFDKYMNIVLLFYLDFERLHKKSSDCKAGETDEDLWEA